MTREYKAADKILADKLKDRFYIRDEAMAYSYSSAKNRRRRNPYMKNENYVREARADTVRTHQPKMKTAPRTVNRETVETARENGMKINPSGEIVVKNKTINPLFVACLFVVTLMLLALVMCFSQVYQTSSDVGQLERQLEALKAEEAELTVRLDTKNDIRTIETIATTKLGMVKEESLQKKFISLSEGEHIEVTESETASETTGGVMLSSILSSIGEFFDRFK